MNSRYSYAFCTSMLFTLGLLILRFSAPAKIKFHKGLNKIVSSSSFKDTLLPCKRKEVSSTGSFCLDETIISVGGNGNWDIQICKDVEALFGYSTVVDLGAGLGHYGKCLLRTKTSMFFLKNNRRETKMHNEYINSMSDWLQKPQIIKSWDGYDGAINVEYLSRGFIKQQDLSANNLWLGKTWDWVLSLEVGEHVPQRYEDNFIDNLIRHGCKGIVLSWALEGQGGHHHVNGRSNAYIKQKMSNRGLVDDVTAEEFLRNRTSIWWFKRTLMVFRYPNEYQCGNGN